MMIVTTIRDAQTQTLISRDYDQIEKEMEFMEPDDVADIVTYKEYRDDWIAQELERLEEVNIDPLEKKRLKKLISRPLIWFVAVTSQEERVIHRIQDSINLA